jgi:hypothetical protein
MGKFGLNLRKRQRALLLGFEQTRVFDRDHCLVGKVLEKRDLLGVEWSVAEYGGASGVALTGELQLLAGRRAGA